MAILTEKGKKPKAQSDKGNVPYSPKAVFIVHYSVYTVSFDMWRQLSGKRSVFGIPASLLRSEMRGV